MWGMVLVCFAVVGFGCRSRADVAPDLALGQTRGFELLGHDGELHLSGKIEIPSGYEIPFSHAGTEAYWTRTGGPDITLSIKEADQFSEALPCGSTTDQDSNVIDGARHIVLVNEPLEDGFLATCAYETRLEEQRPERGIIRYMVHRLIHVGGGTLRCEIRWMAPSTPERVLRQAAEICRSIEVHVET